MYPRYQEAFELIEQGLREIGFHLEDDSDEYVVYFSNGSPWVITFGCERYDEPPICDVIIEDTSYEDSHIHYRYYVDVLMHLFLKNFKGKGPYWLDSLRAQIAFLKECKGLLFVSPQPYRQDYKNHPLMQIVD